MNEDGEEEIFEIYGMMKFSLEDDNGKFFVMLKFMKVYLDFDKFNLIVFDGNVLIKFYWFDRKIGCWRLVGDFVFEDGSKRRWKCFSYWVFFVGIVILVIVKEDFNFDKLDYRVGLRVIINLVEDGVIIIVIC